MIISEIPVCTEDPPSYQKPQCVGLFLPSSHPETASYDITLTSELHYHLTDALSYSVMQLYIILLAYFRVVLVTEEYGSRIPYQWSVEWWFAE